MKRFSTLLILATFALMIQAQSAPKKVYNDDLNPMEQIAQALVKANESGKYVICQVGGNWCPWCLRFADFITKDDTISKVVNDNFEYIHVSYNPREEQQDAKAAQTKAMMVRLGNPARFGFPVFVVLDEKGQVIHIQDSSFLEQGQGYDKEKVLRFFQAWTPQAVKQ